MAARPAESLDARALIIVTEPDPHVRRLQRYFLEKAGLDVEFATNGEDGLARARLRHPRILVTEILLQKQDGLSLCRALKADPSTRDIQIVVFSILAAEDRSREAGADAFLRKPLDDTKLVDTVRKLLENGPTGG